MNKCRGCFECVECRIHKFAITKFLTQTWVVAWLISWGNSRLFRSFSGDGFSPRLSYTWRSSPFFHQKPLWYFVYFVTMYCFRGKHRCEIFSSVWTLFLFCCPWHAPGWLEVGIFCISKLLTPVSMWGSSVEAQKFHPMIYAMFMTYERSMSILEQITILINFYHRHTFTHSYHVVRDDSSGRELSLTELRPSMWRAQGQQEPFWVFFFCSRLQKPCGIMQLKGDAWDVWPISFVFLMLHAMLRNAFQQWLLRFGNINHSWWLLRCSFTLGTQHRVSCCLSPEEW